MAKSQKNSEEPKTDPATIVTPSIETEPGTNSGSGHVTTFDALPEVTSVLTEIENLKEENKLLRENAAKATGFTVVIPYLKEKARGDELKYALRSIETHFKYTFYNVVVVGDREDWFDHHHIVYLFADPQKNIINMIKEVLCSDLVADNIIWSNDNIYFVSPVEACDIQTFKVDGMLKDERTTNLLKSRKLPISNFETHMPVMYEKNKLIELFEDMPELNEGDYSFSSVYFNYHYPYHKPIQLDWKTDNWLLRLVSENPPLNVFNKIVNTKKFLNNSEQGYSTVLTDYLNNTFTKQSKYEV